MSRLVENITIFVAALLLASVAFNQYTLASELEEDWFTVDIHGFISQGYLKSDKNQFYANTKDGTFQFNEVGVNFSTELTDSLRVGLQLLSRDLGDVGNNAIEIDWAYGLYRWKDWLTLQAGLIKTPWGLYNDTRDLDMLRTPIFLPPSLYVEEARGIYNSIWGIGVGGSFLLGNVGALNYQCGFGEKDITPMIKELQDGPYVNILDITVGNILGGIIDWETPLDGLRLRTSLGRYDYEGEFQVLSPGGETPESAPPQWFPIHKQDKNNFYSIFSAEYTWNNLVLATEYYSENHGHKDPEEGYYASAAYRVSDWLELGAYYSVAYPDARDKNGEKLHEATGRPEFFAWQKEWVLTTRFDFNEYWLLKLEGHFINGVGRLPFDDPIEPQEIEENSFLFAVKTTFSF